MANEAKVNGGSVPTAQPMFSMEQLQAMVAQAVAQAVPTTAAGKPTGKLTVPPKVAPKAKGIPAAGLGMNTTVKVNGSIVTLTYDMSDSRIYYDKDGQIREDKNGNLRPYVQFAYKADADSKSVFFGMSIPDLRQ